MTVTKRMIYEQVEAVLMPTQQVMFRNLLEDFESQCFKAGYSACKEIILDALA